jgi:hypothetical protein
MASEAEAEVGHVERRRRETNIRTTEITEPLPRVDDG